MCLKILASTFVILVIVLTVQLLSLCFNITEKMKPMQLSNYVSSVAGVMFAYVVNAFLLILVIPDVYSKILMAAFGIIPFMIGSVVSYHKLKFYSIIQIECIVTSGFYIIGL